MKDDSGVTPFPASSKGASRRLEAPPADQPRPLPGQLEVIITHLQMLTRPLPSTHSHRGEKLALMRAEGGAAGYVDIVARLLRATFAHDGQDEEHER